MPLIGYKAQFAPLVESGEKRQTVRAMRKRPFRVGDRLYHYAGLRTRKCRKLLESECIMAADIRIDESGKVWICGIELHARSKEVLAKADGFRDPGSCWKQMLDFIKAAHGLPFKGQLITW